MTISREDIEARSYTLEQGVRAEIDALRSTGQLGDGYKNVPRCHVCCETESRELVNTLLAAGLTNAEIAQSCEHINNRRIEADDVRTIRARNVWSHKREHFPVQERTAALARQIMERRADQANLDFINGVGHAITPYAVLETVMALGYGPIADGSVAPNISDTISASVKLHEMTSKDAGERHYADLLFKMDRIISIAEKYVPVDQREAFVSEVEGGSSQPLQILSERMSEEAETVRSFAPNSGIDDGDDL